ncbi:hypothetical protein [Citreimonas sp.]|uniref:hypothetical protein n=1 Tax=Citreimonas sp. TaxID=3036715 RepID=UPI004058CD34
MRSAPVACLAAAALAACTAQPQDAPAVPAEVVAALPDDLSPREVGQNPDGCWYYVVGGDAVVPLNDADGAPVCT